MSAQNVVTSRTSEIVEPRLPSTQRITRADILVVIDDVNAHTSVLAHELAHASYDNARCSVVGSDPEANVARATHVETRREHADDAYVCSEAAVMAAPHRARNNDAARRVDADNVRGHVAATVDHNVESAHL